MMYCLISNLRLSRELTLGENEDILDCINEDIPMYMFEECRNYEYLREETSIFNGTVPFSLPYYPGIINWYSDENRLINDEDTDDFPISTLQYLITNFLVPKGIQTTGHIIQVNANKSQVFWYNLENNRLVYHINKSMDLTEFWRQCRKCHRNFRVSDDFINIISNNLRQNETYDTYISSRTSAYQIFLRFYHLAL